MLRPIAGLGSIALGIVFASIYVLDALMTSGIADTFAALYAPAVAAVSGVAFGLYLIMTSFWRGR